MLSVFNGFEGLVSSLTSRFDPELRIQPTLGKTFHDSDTLRSVLLSHPDVEAVGTTLEETVLLSYGGHQIPAIMKGVDSTFARVTQIDDILLGEDGFLLKDEVADYCILGAGLASIISINRGFVRPLTVFCPRLIDKKGYADAYRIMQIEKWLTFLLVFFILLIASFNAIGALSMLIIDKEAQISTLRNMGADPSLIRRIFTCEGWLITGIGAVVGLILGIILCLLQQHFGFITLGGDDTTRYVVAAYPVLLHWSDALLTLLAVAAVGFLSTFYTVKSTL